jgi:hypothetical protein
MKMRLSLLPVRTVPPAKVPLPELPTTYVDDPNRKCEVANQDPEGAARLDAEDVDPSVRGFFRLPGTLTLIKFAGFVKTDLLLTQISFWPEP